MFEQQLVGDTHAPRMRSVALGSVSVSLHVAVLLIFWVARLVGRGDLNPKPKMPPMVVDLPLFVIPRAAPKAANAGGGALSQLPVSRGEAAPPLRTKTFILPVTNPEAQLKIQVSMPPMDAPVLDSGQYGDPNAQSGIFSLGQGGPHGMGPGGAGNVGSGGDEKVFRPGGGVSTPILILKVDPDFSDEARRVKMSGKVLLKIVVDAKGKPTNITVVQALGCGLDEKAKEAVRNWRFEPGRKDGRAVAVEAIIEVNFRLL